MNVTAESINASAIKIICDRCGVEITTSAVRRERMGHIKLATPISHIWYFKGSSSPISVILDVPPQSMEKIIYYALYLVKSVDKEKQKSRRAFGRHE